jgi:hypothetical protein
MANSNTAGFGLTPSRVLGQTPSTQGLGQYWIDAANGTSIYNGEAVYTAGGYIVGAQGSATTATLGTLNGIFYNAATTEKPTWANSYQATITPANSEDTKAFVYDNPFQVFEVGTDDAVAAGIPAAHVKFFETFGMNTSAGSSTTGKSSATLNIGATSATANQWKLIGVSEDPSNEDLTAAYCTVNVVQNLNEIIDSA